MYSQFFGFKLNPFSQTPPANNDYLPSSHCAILDELAQAIQVSNGLFLLHGSIGVGKSSLIKALVDRGNGLIINDLTPASNLQSSISASTHLAMMINSISTDSSSSNSNEQPTIFFLDNANLYEDGLLKSLLNKISQCNDNNIPTLLILTGQALLELNIQEIQIEISSSLLVKLFYLKPFENLEIKDYINYRLSLASYSESILFTDDAIQRIAILSKGLPRVINTICGVSIFQASLEELHIINEELVDKASEFCFLAKDVEEELSLKESIEQITNQFKLKAPDSSGSTSIRIPDKQVNPVFQTSVAKNIKPNNSELISLSNTNPIGAIEKEQAVLPTSAVVKTHSLSSLSSPVNLRSPLVKPLGPHLAIRPPESSVFSRYRFGAVIFSVSMVILLLAATFWEHRIQFINPDSVHIPLTTVDSDDLSDNNDKVLLVTQIRKNVIDKPIESTTDDLKAPISQSVTQKVDIKKQYEKLKSVEKTLFESDQKKNNNNLRIVNIKPKKPELKINRPVLAKVKKQNVKVLKPTLKLVHTKKVKIDSTKVLSVQELAVKKRASARYKLAQKGIRYDVDSYFSSAEKGNNELLKLFLAAKMPIDIPDKPTRNTILIKATKKGHLDVVTTALDNKAKVNRQNREGKTALITAAANGHYAISHKLLTFGANVHIRDNKGWDALLFAVQRNELTIVKELLKHGANKNTKDSAGVSALLMAKNNNQYEMLSLLETSN